MEEERLFTYSKPTKNTNKSRRFIRLLLILIIAAALVGIILYFLVSPEECIKY